jgi:hypothetical protein
MTAGDVERAKALVLDYHRMMPSEPRFAACLIGRSLIESIDDLDAAYDELVKAGELEVAGTAQAIDKRNPLIGPVGDGSGGPEGGPAATDSRQQSIIASDVHVSIHLPREASPRPWRRNAPRPAAPREWSTPRG